MLYFCPFVCLLSVLIITFITNACTTVTHLVTCIMSVLYHYYNVYPYIPSVIAQRPERNTILSCLGIILNVLFIIIGMGSKHYNYAVRDSTGSSMGVVPQSYLSSAIIVSRCYSFTYD